MIQFFQELKLRTRLGSHYALLVLLIALGVMLMAILWGWRRWASAPTP